MTTATKKNTETAAEVLKELSGPIKPKATHGTPADTLTPTRPDDTSLDALGQFAKAAAQAGAEKAWELGRACVLAKMKCEAEKKPFGEWADAWIPDVTERTRQRYMKVGVLDYDTVKGKSKDEVYKLVFGEDYATGTKKAKKQKASVRKRLDELEDEAILEAAMKHDIDADPVELRLFLSDIFDALK